MTTLPPHLQPRLDRELDEDEAVRWVAQPSYRLLKKQAWVGWGLCMTGAILFGGLFATIGVLEHFYPDPSPESETSPMGLMIFGGGLILVVAATLPLFFRYAKFTANNTIYAITDKRAIIIAVARDKSITERDYRGDELIHLARKESPDGSGTLTFESARGAGTSTQTSSRHRFQAIEDVIGVERMLRKQFGAS